MIARRLLEDGAVVRAYDPAAGETAGALIPALDVRPDPYEASAGADVVALLTEWDEFRWLDFERVRDVDATPGDRRRPQPARPGGHAPARLRRYRAASGDGSMSRIVVTGGAGFLGSHLCEALLARGDEVVAVDNFVTGPARQRRRTSPTSPASSSSSPTSPRSSRSTGAVDGVLHFASPASPPEYLADAARDARRRLDRHPPRARPRARSNGARFLLASTSEVYGDPLVHPQTESYFGNVDPIGPRAVYDEAKRFAETLTMTYHRLYGLRHRIVRIFNTYGPRLAAGRRSGRLELPRAGDRRQAAHGLRRRHADAFVLLRRRRGARASSRSFDSDVVEPVNIGNPDEFTMLELAELVLEVTGSSAELVFEPLPIGDPDAAPARHHACARAARLGAARSTLREGLARTHAWYWRSAPVAERDADAAEAPQALGRSCPCSTSATRVVEIVRRMRAVELPDGIEREIIVVDDGSTDGTRDVLRQLGDSTVRVVMHEAQPRQGRRGPHRARARDRRLRARPGRRPRVRPRRLADAARAGARGQGAGRLRLALHRRAPQHAVPALDRQPLPVARSPTCSTTRRSPTWRPVTSSSTATLLDGITLRADRFDIEPEITAKILQARDPHLRGADLLHRPRVRRGQEDHLARRLRGAVDAREVPLRATDEHAVPAVPRWAAVVVNYEAGPLLLECVALGARRHERGPGRARRRRQRLARRLGRRAARGASRRRASSRAPGNVGYAARREPRHRGDAGADRRGAAIADTRRAAGRGRRARRRGSTPSRGSRACGPRLRNPDGIRLPVGADDAVDSVAAIGTACSGCGGRRTGSRARYRQLDADPDRPRVVDWVSGAAIWLRRDALDDVGGWDERYFMYIEDIDLCWRLRAVGMGDRVRTGGGRRARAGREHARRRRTACCSSTTARHGASPEHGSPGCGPCCCRSRPCTSRHARVMAMTDHAWRVPLATISIAGRGLACAP